MMYNDQLVYKIVIWAFYAISLWTEKVALKGKKTCSLQNVGVASFHEIRGYFEK